MLGVASAYRSRSAKDVASFQGGAAHLQFILAPTSGKSGDTLQLTIKKLSNNNSYGIEIFVLQASGGGKQTLYWASTGAN